MQYILPQSGWSLETGYGGSSQSSALGTWGVLVEHIRSIFDQVF